MKRVVMAAKTRKFGVGRPMVRTAAAGLAAMVLVAGCSVQKHYKLLSTFFDGVPNPDAPAQSVNVSLTVRPSENNGSATIKLYQHKPYAEKKCTECHTADKAQLITTKAELCIKCHEPAMHQYSKMHGPVSVGQCLWCHEAHESDQPMLLKTTAPDLCLQCHDRDLLPSENPAHQSEDANCLDCHVGHGSGKASLLRADNPTLGPASALLIPQTQPASGDGGTPQDGGAP
jgi:predicted CXXCH cytochrome family protein